MARTQKTETDKAPTVAALDRLQKTLETGDRGVREGDVIGGQDGWRYRHIDTTNKTPDVIRVERQVLRDRGLIPVTGPEAEESHGDLYVYGRPNAEIWAASPEVVAYWRQYRFDRAHSRKLWRGAQASRMTPLVRPGVS